MKLYHLGHVPWEQSQLIYHALPRLGMEGLILLSPASPYVCIGYHQDATQDVDLEYCREHNIPVFRREVGGGATYLDGQQLFYQLVLNRDHPLATSDKATLYQRVLDPIAQAYRDLGIEAYYRPVNDIITDAGRKISGTGAAHIAESVILVGNLIFDFDYRTMVHVLRVPDEKYRDKVHKSLYENLTTMRRELDTLPSEDKAVSVLVRRYEEILGSLEPAPLPAEVLDKVEELRPQFLSDEWLHQRTCRAGAGRVVKIATGIHIVQRVHKTPGGLVRVTLEVKDDVIEAASITGDFFFYPEQKLAELEDVLQGKRLADVTSAISAFYAEQGIDSPGLTPADLGAILQGNV